MGRNFYIDFLSGLGKVDEEMVMKVFCIFGFENFVERFFGEFSGG